MSFSDVSGYESNSSQNSSQRSKFASSTASERAKHLRSYPQLGGDDVEIPKVFQTINEESEDVIEGSEYRLRKDESSVDEESTISGLASFLSCKGKNCNED